MVGQKNQEEFKLSQNNEDVSFIRLCILPYSFAHGSASLNTDYIILKMSLISLANIG